MNYFSVLLVNLFNCLCCLFARALLYNQKYLSLICLLSIKLQQHLVRFSIGWSHIELIINLSYLSLIYSCLLDDIIICRWQNADVFVVGVSRWDDFSGGDASYLYVSIFRFCLSFVDNISEGESVCLQQSRVHSVQFNKQ